MKYKAIIFDLNDVLLVGHPRKKNTELVVLLPELIKKGLLLFTLSNSSREGKIRNEKQFTWLQEYFIKNYYSCEMGHYKPDPRAWQQILAENNLVPQECLYFDNSETHVLAANNLGIHAYVFKDAQGILDKLE